MLTGPCVCESSTHKKPRPDSLGRRGRLCWSGGNPHPLEAMPVLVEEGTFQACAADVVVGAFGALETLAHDGLRVARVAR